MFLSDAQWSLLQPIFSSTASRGRPPAGARPILEAIFWKLTSRKSWYDIPSTTPSWQTCYQHYRRWKSTGIWTCLIKTLFADLHTRGGFDLAHAIDTHELTIKSNFDGQLDVTYPPALEGTWQISTALLLITLLHAEL